MRTLFTLKKRRHLTKSLQKPTKVEKIRESSVYFRAMIAVFLSKSLRLTKFYGGKGAVLF
jgi:hypothetical protein